MSSVTCLQYANTSSYYNHWLFIALVGEHYKIVQASTPVDSATFARVGKTKTEKGQSDFERGNTVRCGNIGIAKSLNIGIAKSLI